MQFMKKTFSQSFLKKIAILPVASLAVAACNPPAGDSGDEDNNEIPKDVLCEVTSSGSIELGSEYTASLACELPTLHQGNRLRISYGDALSSLKLVVDNKEQEGKAVANLSYRLPRNKVI